VLSARGAAGQVLREQWRFIAAFERMPVKRKAGLLRKLCDSASLEPHFYWVLARLCTRRPLHGPENCIIPATRLDPALNLLFNGPVPKDDHAARLYGLALSAACTRCGVRNLDVRDDKRGQAVATLRQNGLTDLADRLESGDDRGRAEQEELLGDSLPLGLELAGTDNRQA